MKKNTARSAATATTRTDTYVRVPDFAARIGGVQFPPPVWDVFAQCEAPSTSAEIARRTRLDETEVVAALRRLARRRLVCKNQLDWQTYLTSQRTPPVVASPMVAATVPVVPVPLIVTVAKSSPAPVVAAPAEPVPPVPVVPAAAVAVSPAIEAKPPAFGSVLEFTVGNDLAAVARRDAARDQFCFTVGKSLDRQPSLVV